MRRLVQMLLITLAPVGPVAAAEADAQVRYVPLTPTFVTNYGVSERGSLSYLKADVTLRVSSLDAELALEYHAPQLRNALVLLFSRQDEASVSSVEGREQMRQEALEALKAIMEAEEGQPYIEDLVFENFIVQR